MQGFEASLPPPKHKRSTDEVFSEPQRLHKVLASCGFGSRRAMEEMILAGRITVNRMPAEIGQKVGPGDEVRINGEPVKVRFAEPKARVLVYHKPTGELVTRDDPEERPTVFGMLPAIRDGRWIAVGRLDYNTEGLLLFTNSGELANRLMHPRYEVEREYAVRVMGRLTDEQVATLLRGVELDDGPAKCEKVEDAGGDEDASNHWYKVVVKEGRNREVRRLFEVLGLTVSRLLRVRYGRVAMPPQLKRGEVMELEPQEVAALLKSAGLKAQGGGPVQESPQGQRPGHKPKHARPEGQGQGGPGSPAGDGRAGAGRKRRRGRKRSGAGPTPSPSSPDAAGDEQQPRHLAHGEPRAHAIGPMRSGTPSPDAAGDDRQPRHLAHGQPRRHAIGPMRSGTPSADAAGDDRQPRHLAHGQPRGHAIGPMRGGSEPHGNASRGSGGYGQGGGGQARHRKHGGQPRAYPIGPMRGGEANGNVAPGHSPQGPAGQPGQKKRRRRGRGGAGGGPKAAGAPQQKWVGLPKDEDE